MRRLLQLYIEFDGLVIEESFEPFEAGLNLRTDFLTCVMQSNVYDLFYWSLVLLKHLEGVRSQDYV